MPARIMIQSGISVGTSHWIERPVIRIGSDPQSDVCLPSADVPAHALTLEFRGGTYRVYNRCPNEVSIGGQLVAAGTGREWFPGESLQLTDIELVLDSDADPSPQPARTQLSLDDELQQGLAGTGATQDAIAETPSSPASNVNTILQTIVIGLCVLGCIGLLLRDRGESNANRPSRPKFSAIVRTALASESTSTELVQRLQYAEAAMVRGHIDSAKERFGKLRDDLIPQKDSFASGGRQPELDILDFIEHRLGELD